MHPGFRDAARCFTAIANVSPVNGRASSHVRAGKCRETRANDRTELHHIPSGGAWATSGEGVDGCSLRRYLS
jgi:hypothetical protein